MDNRILGCALQDAQPGYVCARGSVSDALQTVSDSRQPQGQRWPTALVLRLAVLAKLAGQASARGIATGINLRSERLNAVLQLPVYTNRQRVVRGPPATTYGRVPEPDAQPTGTKRGRAALLRLMPLVRAPWGIENGLHDRRDVSLHEDAGQWRLPTLGFVMALLNTIVLTLPGREQSLPAQRLACDANPFLALKHLLNAPN